MTVRRENQGCVSNVVSFVAFAEVVRHSVSPVRCAAGVDRELLELPVVLPRAPM